MQRTTRDLVISVDAQTKRIAAELDSEKRTRANANSEVLQKFDRLENRVRQAEFKLALALGFLIAMQAGNAFGVFDHLKPKAHENEKSQLRPIQQKADAAIEHRLHRPLALSPVVHHEGPQAVQGR